MVGTRFFEALKADGAGIMSTGKDESRRQSVVSFHFTLVTKGFVQCKVPTYLTLCTEVPYFTWLARV